MRLRRLRPLSAADLALLPGDCACGGRRMLAASAAWAHAGIERYGICGVAAFDGAEPIGWLLISPALNLPAAHPLASGPRDADAAQLLQAHVVEAWRGIGIGRQMMQSLAARLVPSSTGIDAMGSGPGSGLGSAVGPGGAPASSAGAPCLAPPISWLEDVGFVEVATHQATGEPAGAHETLSPRRRMRLDLHRTRRWTPDPTRALSWARGWAGPASAPEPGLSRHAE